MSLEEIRNARLEKLKLIQEAGMDPYPAHTARTHEIAKALESFEKIEQSEETITLAGRIRAIRGHGGSAFVDIEDGTGRIQTLFKKDILGDKSYDLFGTLDLGDFVEATGRLFLTKKEERTLEVREWNILAKTLLPLPEKWHGLQDVEERYRRRYLDLVMNQDVRERFRTRSKITRAVRAFFDADGFLEVETPILNPIAGGALAKPFVTRHNALDIDLYLRIAPELYLKRLLVGGFEKVYELGRLFRNEGIDHTHNPEFTTIEWYAAYWDEEDMMKSVEGCFLSVLDAINLGREISFGGKKIVFADTFDRIHFSDLLKKYAGVENYANETKESLKKRAEELGIRIDPHESKGKIADELFKKVARPKLVNPTFVTNHPLDISPLAKRSGKNPEEVRRFQLVVGGFELVNAFSELNDPIDQRSRFEEQENRKTGGEAETHDMDVDFVEALEYGMPPAAGAAISIDRLAMLLTDTDNIREVLLFPTMRPLE